MTEHRFAAPEPGHPPLWRRPLLGVLRRRPRWATAYVRRQLRLADEELLAATSVAGHVERAADAVERTPLPRLADRHRLLRGELYAAVRRAERRLARSGAYQLKAAGLVVDDAAAEAVGYVAAEVRPALERIRAELVEPASA